MSKLSKEELSYLSAEVLGNAYDYKTQTWNYEYIEVYTKDKPTSWDNEEFYDLMQQYRHTPLADQVVVTKKFNNVKKYISTLLKEQRESLIEEIRELAGKSINYSKRENRMFLDLLENLKEEKKG